MGNISQKNALSCVGQPTCDWFNLFNSNIRVADLNFSGISLSPFQYFDTTNQILPINQKFMNILGKYVKIKNFEWNVGKIDLKLQKQRYSPVYRDNICVENNRLIDKNRFDILWQIQFQKNKYILKEEFEENQKNHMKLFDWVAYETFLNCVYGENQLINIDNLEKFDANKFIEFLNKWHSKSFLRIEEKMKKVSKFIKQNNIDVMFLQQAEIRGKSSWNNQISNDYGIVNKQTSESVIIYKKQRFILDQRSKDFIDHYGPIINFNNDTVFLKTRNYLLIAAHISSKKSKNLPQLKNMFQTLKKIKKQNSNLQIIVGVDANSTIEQDLKSGFFLTKGGGIQKITTHKKRTALQPQTRKIGVEAMDTRDYIISTKNIEKQFIGQIDGDNVENKYLPSDSHPFDHFLIKAQINGKIDAQNQD